jgi:hypothetical protein
LVEFPERRDRQIEFLKNWEAKQLDNPLGLDCHFEH